MAARTETDKAQLTRERQNAVRQAWKNEKELVENGEGTRDWTPEEQEELLERGSVQGYQGHHMKSVEAYPEYAGDPNNIQFLDEDEHVHGAHQGCTRNPSNGYYDPETGKIQSFGNHAPTPVPVIELSEPCKEEQFDYMDSIAEDAESSEAGETTEFSNSSGKSQDYGL